MMSSFSLQKEIARHIVLSQIASDAGKGIYELNIRNSSATANRGYTTKEKHILAAIKLIDNSRGQSGFYYYCVKKEDQNGNPSKIVYFSFKGKNGKRFQVSFHCYSGGEIKEKAQANKGLMTHWDHKNSRLACKILIQDYCLR